MRVKRISSIVTSVLIILMVSMNIGCVQAQHIEPVISEEVGLIEIEGVEVPVLMYHHIAENVPSGNTLIVSPEKFKSDMVYLKEQGYSTIGLNELHMYLKGEIEIPDKPIIVTFDDGYKSNYVYAYPIAKELDMKFVISVVGWSMGRETFIDSDKPITPHFTLEEAKEMVESGNIEIQHHTYDLHNPEGLSYGYGTQTGQGVKPYHLEEIEHYKVRLEEDLVKLNILLEEIGIKTQFIIYPYGAYVESTEEVIKDIGFVGSVTTKEGLKSYKNIEDLYEIPRFNVTEEMTGEDIVNKIIGEVTSVKTME